MGLLTARADAGRVHDALRGYRDVIDYFARTGNWTHQWVALRNLAGLLRAQLCDRVRRACRARRGSRSRTPPAIRQQDDPVAAPPSWRMAAPVGDDVQRSVDGVTKDVTAANSAPPTFPEPKYGETSVMSSVRAQRP
ncbi:MAG: hypothetical protein ACRDTH_11855 [Pseudonocardiaceae bacterium]